MPNPLDTALIVLIFFMVLWKNVPYEGFYPFFSHWLKILSFLHVLRCNMPKYSIRHWYYQDTKICKKLQWDTWKNRSLIKKFKHNFCREFLQTKKIWIASVRYLNSIQVSSWLATLSQKNLFVLDITGAIQCRNGWSMRLIYHLQHFLGFCTSFECQPQHVLIYKSYNFFAAEGFYWT